MWQALQNELADTNFQVISVALESRGVSAALPYIEPVKPTLPVLIDHEHEVARLFGMINVPNAVWINEDGRIVRPSEAAGSNDAFRSMDRTTGKMEPDKVAALRATRETYLNGLRDWARSGDASPWALSPAEVRARFKRVTPEQARARAHFQLGEYLWQQGNGERARANFDEAVRLHPESWEYKRQAWDLEAQGKAGGPEFWNAVEALGDTEYYPSIRVPG